MAAFEDFKQFRVPSYYHYQQDTEASRFLIALQEDFCLEEQFSQDPASARPIFPI